MWNIDEFSNMLYLKSYSIVYIIERISSFCGTSLLLGLTTLKPKNMNTRMSEDLSVRSFFMQTKTRLQSSWSSANSSNDTKLSLEPSGKIFDGISTYKFPLIKRVFQRISFSSLKLDLK